MIQQSLSFDGIVSYYDETRVFDPGCFDAALDYLVEEFSPECYREILEPGIGTGRVAIPLARRGYKVSGVDISERMLALLNKRLNQTVRLPLAFQKADLTDLPFPDGRFDIALAVHLFYFIPMWRKAAREMLRVIKPERPVLLMHTGTGLEIPFLNERYRQRCARQGYPSPPIGVRSTREVVDYFASLGCEIEEIRDRWTWNAHIRLEEALHYLKVRAYAFTTVAPDEVHASSIEELESELWEEYGDLTTEIDVPNQIYLVIIHRP